MSFKRFFCVLLLIVIVTGTTQAKGGKGGKQHGGKQASKFVKSHHRGQGSFHNKRRDASSSNVGLWPSIFNLATKASITANATCGEISRQEFCRMAENGKGRCGVCDNFSPDPGKRHPAEYAIDGGGKWWQSPPLHYGREFEYVTLTLDLGQIYQIAYVIIKAANSPRPGTWILEKSLDGITYQPWQYFARSDKECWEKFGIPAVKGKPRYYTDTEVICTSFYSRLTPLENGEIHTSLIQGRPGANGTSPELLEFTKARYVRLRLMGLRGTQEPIPRWLAQDIFKDKRLFYSIRDISVGGQCLCNGHAESCRYNVASGHPECECSHHTCGPNCDSCCPLYNQRHWGPGSSRDARHCLPCNCHGHATSCHYDEQVDKAGLSLDQSGNYQGGGVCDNCTDFTTGINCELCLPGYFRPFDLTPSSPQPCHPCSCDPIGTSSCVQYGEEAGTCNCLSGYEAARCDKCSPGFRGWPRCEPCPCDPKGSVGMKGCEGDCVCKENVEGKYCDRCKPGHFGLRNDLQQGCLKCYCSKVTSLCESAIVQRKTIRSLHDWLLSDLQVSNVVKPNWNGQNVFSLGSYEIQGGKSFYWLAPSVYLGNQLEAYNGKLIFKVQWVVMRGDTSGEPTRGPNVVIISKNDEKIAHGDDTFHTSAMEFTIKLQEYNWYHLKDPSSGQHHGSPVTRGEFLKILSNVQHILLRSTFHTDQIEVLLEEAVIEFEDEEEGYGSVEKCSCPSGYSGLSCESCSYGYVMIPQNKTTDVINFCTKCDCNGHSSTCNPDNGECFCEHNTIGEKCERCAPGYYGNPTRATPGDCKRCACPLDNPENNFSPSCQLDFHTMKMIQENYDIEGSLEEEGYVCTQCPRGYTGDHCEICDDGFYGNPLEIGNNCKPCDCNGGPCDRKTGQCLSCKGNTEGWKCERCKPEHYGDPTVYNCKSCECDPTGSLSRQCNNVTGQCECKEKFIGRSCDRCEVGYGNVTALCPPCSCDPTGSKSDICDTHTGICDCKPGVEGFRCDACQNLYFGFSDEGCEPCNCDPDGSKFTSCNVTSGLCVCKPNFHGDKCDQCEDNFWRESRVECVPCSCNPQGTAKDTICEKENGKCKCKPGIGGTRCDVCLPDHYGSIQSGCKKCDQCDKKGHICDPNNGKCVCPKLTDGESCENCSENAWGYEPGIGCKSCNCSISGSSTLNCDHLTGRCKCKPGYQGHKCNSCSFGYYGYPNCKTCECDSKGTLDKDCQSGICGCSNNGTCHCKENVQGAKCDTCKVKSYGLIKENLKGCTNCFCFNRSDKCKSARYSWDKIRMQKNFEDTNSVDQINDILMLPRQFLGDITLSYGGYLTVVLPQGSVFYVYLEGNGVTIQNFGTNEVQILETSGWKLEKGSQNFPENCNSGGVLTRDCFMTVLQGVSGIRIEAQERINEVLLDKAVPNVPDYTPTLTIEECECAPEYTGLSCQDPSEGYYRYFPRKKGENWVDKVIGVARKCECNGMSDKCDGNTGKCKNCTNHTTGDHCELCDTGYYMDRNGECSACLCPNADQNNAESCSPVGESFVCNCKPGFGGSFCTDCESGYYNKNLLPNGPADCSPCDCNPHGVIPQSSGKCDQFGNCHCRTGFKGPKCSQCSEPREIIISGVCSPCDECSQLLFDEIDDLETALNDTFDLFKDGIAPPWKVLIEKLENHQLLTEKFKKIHDKTEKILNGINIDNIKNKTYLLKEMSEEQNTWAEENWKEIDQLYDNSNKIIKESEITKKKLVHILENLENFGKERISLEEALNRAKKIQKHIQGVKNRLEKLQENSMFSYCQNVSDKVDLMYNYNPLVPNLNEFNSKLNDLIEKTAQIEELINLAQNLNLDNSRRLNSLKNKLEDFQHQESAIKSTVEDTIKKINAINDVVVQLGKVYEDLRKMSEFKEYKELESRTKRQMEEIDEMEALYLLAGEHVQELERKVDKYQSMFNFTKDEWKKINASGAYEALINGINEARKTTKMTQKILENATKIIDPLDSDRLIDKTNLAHAYSDRLKQRINNLKDISKDFNKIKNNLDDLKYSILENGKSNNDLTQILHKIEGEITTQGERVANIEEVIANSSNLAEEMREVDKNVSDLEFDKQHLFFKEYQNFLNLTTAAEINNLTNKLKHARRKLQELNISNTHLDKTKGFNSNNDISEKIKQLQNKISYAKQIADTINVPMNLTNCNMVYKLSQRQFFQSLTITYRCKNDCKLFKWTKKNGENLELLVEKSKLKIIIGNNKISLENKTEPDIEKTVNLLKTSSLLKISLEDLEVESKRISGNYNVLDLEDVLEVGEIGKSSGGYLVKIILNGKNFGLWNFQKTQGNCKGQKRIRPDVPNPDFGTYYAGNGYSIFGTNPALKPPELSWTFEFSTFDENSLIYLAVTEKCPQYIALYLEKGFIHFSTLHDDTHFIHLVTDKKYNTGQNYKLQITLSYDRPRQIQTNKLTIKSENGEEQDNKNETLKLQSKSVVKIKQAVKYLGGVPPTFVKTCVPFNVGSFLGFLKPERPFTNNTSNYGVLSIEKKTLSFTNAWFNPGANLDTSYRKTELNTISFIVKPVNPNGIIFDFSLDTMNGNEDFPNANKIYLKNFKLVVSINGDLYSSSNKLDEGDYNEVVVKFGKQKSLTVNDKKENMDFGNKILIEKWFRMGGDGFVGSIRDVMINHEILDFNHTTVKSFSNVEIGRDHDDRAPAPSSNILNTKSLPLPPNTSSAGTNFTNSMQNTERCAPLADHSIDPEAFKYGDIPNGYSYIKSNFWKREYKLEFSFRSFYPNGVIFVTSSQKLQNFILLDLQEGKLRMLMKGKKKKVPISFGEKKLNDGNWHEVVIERKKRKITVIIDKERRRPVKVPKAGVRDEIYIGGIPAESEFHRIKELKGKLHPFRGCLRAFTINGEKKFTVKNDKTVKHFNLGHCFPNVEEGVFFNGNAYALYKKSYQFNKLREFFFEFRTAEQNGIFVTISAANNHPALSIELENGAVKMSVDSGSEISSVTHNLNSDFALCDDRWHNVTALYSSSELTVNVDGITKGWVVPEERIGDDVEAQLYIGGLPETSSTGTLKSRTNFKGCLRKLKIENTLMDWSNMQYLHNIMLNSCPTGNSENNL